MKLVLPGFDRIVLRTLPVKLDARAAGFHLELLYRLDRDTQADRASLALLDRVGDRNTLDENLLR